MLCPVLLGRTDEVATIRRRISDLGHGRGGVVVLVGPAGVGKSRLLAEVVGAAGAAGATVLSGRAVPGASPVPYRPLSEAFANALRDQARPADARWEGLAAHLGRLVPAWSTGPPPVEGDSPVVLGEASVQLLRLASRGGPVVLLLEDLHWADPETMAVIDYLADAVRSEPMLCVATSRIDGAGDDLIYRLGRRDPDAVVSVAPLKADEVDGMVAACLGVPMAPAGLDEFIRSNSDGLPFVVEELLAGLVASGDLRRSGAHWIIGELRPAVPSSLRDSIRHRLEELDDSARRILGAAALLGRQFEWELLPGIAEVDARAAVDALRRASAEQLIEPEGSGFRFRHALTREAVLEDLLPPERHDLATRAWPAVERANPGLPGPSCELAADLAELAGDPAAASERLIISARRALDDGALVTAEATARRAARLAAHPSARRTPPEAAVALAADETLVDALVAAGKAAEALSVGRPLAEQMAAAGVQPDRVASVRLTLGRAAIVAGDLAAASAELESARTPAGPGVSLAVQAGIDALGAHVALDGGDLVQAEHLADRACRSAQATAQPAIECDALLVLGRIHRSRNWSDGVVCFERAAARASAAGLRQWHLRAEQERVMTEGLVGGPASIRQTRDLAARYGAIATVAILDLTLADFGLGTFETDACREAAEACVDASRRYHLATESVAQLWLAGARALAGDGPAMHEAVDAALSADPDDPRILGDLYGRVLFTEAIVADRLEDVPGLLETMAEHVRRASPGTSIFPGRFHRALLHAASGDPAAAESRAEVERLATSGGPPLFGLARGLVDAAARGRAGDSAAATAMYAATREVLTPLVLGQPFLHTGALLVAPAAHRDGWGDPVGWLRAAEAWFAERGHQRTARRCRLLLGQAGAPMPRRGRGDSEVPVSLRALGVTSREVDVMKLVVAGRTNQAIADELVLSPKTVERHLSSLFVRIGVANRRELARVGAQHLGEQNP